MAIGAKVCRCPLMNYSLNSLKSKYVRIYQFNRVFAYLKSLILDFTDPVLFQFPQTFQCTNTLIIQTQTQTQIKSVYSPLSTSQ